MVLRRRVRGGGRGKRGGELAGVSSRVKEMAERGRGERGSEG